MLPLVYPVLIGDAAVSALVATRIYRHGRAPQEVAVPYITWSISGAPENAFEGPDHDFCRVQVDCWSDDDAQLEALGKAVRDAMEPHAHMTLFEGTPDDTTGRFRMMLLFDWIEPR
ncbi:MAG: hypothetical protein BGO72_21435 [Burkholderiales bacterium 70-64]|nr:MAG: hypothetical protein BGO72_21435 [Burkholderiales bacterium 70-64]